MDSPKAPSQKRRSDPNAPISGKLNSIEALDDRALDIHSINPSKSEEFRQRGSLSRSFKKSGSRRKVIDPDSEDEEEGRPKLKSSGQGYRSSRLQPTKEHKHRSSSKRLSKEDPTSSSKRGSRISKSPSRTLGRTSKSPSRTLGRTSKSPSRTRGHSKSPSRTRGHSKSPSRTRGHSNSPSRTRGHSNSPSRTIGHPNSPSRTLGKTPSHRSSKNLSRTPPHRSSKNLSRTPSHRSSKNLSPSHRSSKNLSRGHSKRHHKNSRPSFENRPAAPLFGIDDDGAIPRIIERKDDPQKKRLLVGIILCLLILLGIAAGVAWYFLTQVNEENVNTNNPSTNNPSASSRMPSEVPTLYPTTLSSSTPTNIPLLFDPPNEEDCFNIRDQRPVRKQDDMVQTPFGLDLDVTVQEGTDTQVWLEALTEAVQQKLILDLTGCSTLQRKLELDSNEHHRYLNENRFVIGNANATGEFQIEKECLPSAPQPCFRYVVTMDLYLKQALSNFELITLVLSIVDPKDSIQTFVERLGLGLSGSFLNVAVVLVGSTTEAPTIQPSETPSVSPSTKPSSMPSSIPTAMPTKQPTWVPSQFPSHFPTYQPSRNPSLQPSKQPSSQPSLQPSKQPSSRPSRQPSNQPSNQPSSQPSKQPSLLPSVPPSVTP